jgi:putative hydrolase of the HAD superfamily
MDAIFEQVTPLPHHVEVLQRLRERQRIAVCSNFTHAATAHRVIDAAGLASLVDVVVISEEVGIRKPRPEIFRETLARLDVAAHETLHIGDNLDADIAGAAAVGAATGWITRRVSDPQRALRAYEGPLPRVRMRDLAELPGLVDAFR